MHVITSHFSCLTYISLFVFWSDTQAGSQGVVFLCQASLFHSCFAYSVWLKTDIVQYLSFSVIYYLYREALCGCVDSLLAMAIQCSVKYFMCVWWSFWNRPWALGSSPLFSTGFYSAELCGSSGHLQDIPYTTVACIRRVGKSIYHQDSFKGVSNKYSAIHCSFQLPFWVIICPLCGFLSSVESAWFILLVLHCAQGSSFAGHYVAPEMGAGAEIQQLMVTVRGGKSFTIIELQLLWFIGIDLPMMEIRREHFDCACFAKPCTDGRRMYLFYPVVSQLMLLNRTDLQKILLLMCSIWCTVLYTSTLLSFSVTFHGPPPTKIKRELSPSKELSPCSEDSSPMLYGEKCLYNYR